MTDPSAEQGAALREIRVRIANGYFAGAEVVPRSVAVTDVKALAEALSTLQAERDTAQDEAQENWQSVKRLKAECERLKQENVEEKRGLLEDFDRRIGLCEAENAKMEAECVQLRKEREAEKQAYATALEHTRAVTMSRDDARHNRDVWQRRAEQAERRFMNAWEDRDEVIGRMKQAEAECVHLRQERDEARRCIEDAHDGRFLAEQLAEQAEAECESMREELERLARINTENARRVLDKADECESLRQRVQHCITRYRTWTHLWWVADELESALSGEGTK